MTATPEQLHALLAHCLDFAKVMLAECGEFFPFGAVVGTDCKIRSAGVADGEEYQSPQAICDSLLDGFTASAGDGSIVAAALVANVIIPAEHASPFPDGIRVLLESEGYSRVVFAPYRLARRGLFKGKRELEFIDPFGVDVAPSVFVAP